MENIKIPNVNELILKILNEETIEKLIEFYNSCYNDNYFQENIEFKIELPYKEGILVNKLLLNKNFNTKFIKNNNKSIIIISIL